MAVTGTHAAATGMQSTGYRRGGMVKKPKAPRFKKPKMPKPLQPQQPPPDDQQDDTAPAAAGPTPAPPNIGGGVPAAATPAPAPAAAPAMAGTPTSPDTDEDDTAPTGYQDGGSVDGTDNNQNYQQWSALQSMPGRPSSEYASGMQSYARGGPVRSIGKRVLDYRRAKYGLTKRPTSYQEGGPVTDDDSQDTQPDPNALQAYMTDDGLPPQEVQRDRQRVAMADPSLNDNQITHRTISDAADGGDMDRASDMLQSYRHATDHLNRTALAALDNGDTVGSLRLAKAAQDYVPDGNELRFGRDADGNLLANVHDADSGELQSSQALTPQRYRDYLEGHASNQDHVIDNGLSKNLQIASSEPAPTGLTTAPDLRTQFQQTFPAEQRAAPVTAPRTGYAQNPPLPQGGTANMLVDENGTLIGVRRDDGTMMRVEDINRSIPGTYTPPAARGATREQDDAAWRQTQQDYADWRAGRKELTPEQIDMATGHWTSAGMYRHDWTRDPTTGEWIVDTRQDTVKSIQAGNAAYNAARNAGATQQEAADAGQRASQAQKQEAGQQQREQRAAQFPGQFKSQDRLPQPGALGGGKGDRLTGTAPTTGYAAVPTGPGEIRYTTAGQGQGQGAARLGIPMVYDANGNLVGAQVPGGRTQRIAPQGPALSTPGPIDDPTRQQPMGGGRFWYSSGDEAQDRAENRAISQRMQAEDLATAQRLGYQPADIGFYSRAELAQRQAAQQAQPAPVAATGYAPAGREATAQAAAPAPTAAQSRQDFPMLAGGARPETIGPLSAQNVTSRWTRPRPYAEPGPLPVPDWAPPGSVQTQLPDGRVLTQARDGTILAENGRPTMNAPQNRQVTYMGQQATPEAAYRAADAAAAQRRAQAQAGTVGGVAPPGANVTAAPGTPAYREQNANDRARFAAEQKEYLERTQAATRERLASLKTQDPKTATAERAVLTDYNQHLTRYLTAVRDGNPDAERFRPSPELVDTHNGIIRKYLGTAYPQGAPAGGGGVTAPVRVGSVEEARKLPSGTAIILPDGSPGRVP